jgi:hypothetical protein
LQLHQTLEAHGDYRKCKIQAAAGFKKEEKHQIDIIQPQSASAMVANLRGRLRANLGRGQPLEERKCAEEEPYYHYHMYHGHMNQKQESVQNIRIFFVMLLQSRALAFLPHVAFGPRSVLSIECTPGSSSASECQPGSREFEAFHCCLLPWEQHTGSSDGCACCLRVAIAR